MDAKTLREGLSHVPLPELPRSLPELADAALTSLSTDPASNQIILGGGIALKHIDHSVFPDVEEAPTGFASDVDRADYLHRICGAWDFDIYPEQGTFRLLKTWKDVFDRFPLSDSPAYHTFRRLFGWPDVPFAKNSSVRLTHEILDRAEGRGEDPYLRLV